MKSWFSGDETTKKSPTESRLFEENKIFPVDFWKEQSLFGFVVYNVSDTPTPESC